MPCAEFVAEIIYKRFAPSSMVEGSDFRFGLGRSGSIETLRTYRGQMGFETHVVEPVEVDLPTGMVSVSSTLTRNLVEMGDFTGARLCLGRDYIYFARVVEGMGFGRKIGVPTCNLGPSEQVMPADGAYAGWAEVDGVKYPAAISIGIRASIRPGMRVVEAHLLDITGDFYGKEIGLQFHSRLRDQKVFADVEDLQTQIMRDIENVRKIDQQTG